MGNPLTNLNYIPTTRLTRLTDMTVGELKEIIKDCHDNADVLVQFSTIKEWPVSDVLCDNTLMTVTITVDE